MGGGGGVANVLGTQFRITADLPKNSRSPKDTLS